MASAAHVLHINIKGVMQAGKTTALRQIARCLAKEGWNVRALNNFYIDGAFGVYDEVFPHDGIIPEPNKDIDPDNVVYITTDMDLVDESIFPEKAGE